MSGASTATIGRNRGRVKELSASCRRIWQASTDRLLSSASRLRRSARNRTVRGERGASSSISARRSACSSLWISDQVDMLAGPRPLQPDRRHEGPSAGGEPQPPGSRPASPTGRSALLPPPGTAAAQGIRSRRVYADSPWPRAGVGDHGERRRGDVRGLEIAPHRRGRRGPAVRGDDQQPLHEAPARGPAARRAAWAARDEPGGLRRASPREQRPQPLPLSRRGGRRPYPRGFDRSWSSPCTPGCASASCSRSGGTTWTLPPASSASAATGRAMGGGSR